MMQTHTPVLLDEHQAAVALGLSSRTLSVWRRRGGDNTIPFVRVSSNRLGMGGNDAN